VTRRASWALACGAAISVLPLFAARYLPFSDLPEHVATIAAFQHYGDPSFRVAEHYEIAWGQSQYFLYHLVGAALAFVVGGAERANLVLMAIVGFSYPYALRALLRALGRDERLALFACPLFFSHALVVGLLPFVASVPLAVFALSLVVRQARAPTRRRALALAAVSIALVLAHVATVVVFDLAAVSLLVTLRAEDASLRESLASLPRRAVWLAPGAALLGAWTALSRIGRLGASLREAGQIEFVRPRSLLRAFALWSHDAWPSHVDDAIAVAFWSTVGALAVTSVVASLRARHRAAPPEIGPGGAGDPSADAPPRARIASLIAPLASVAVVYLALPFRVGATDSLNVRLGVFFPVFALLVLDLRRGLHERLATAAAALLVLASAATNAHEVIAAQASLGDFDRVLAAMEPGSRVVTLTARFDSPPDHFPPWIHVTAYHRARAGGVSEPSFSTLGHWPLHFRAEAAPPPKSEAFWEFHPCLYRNAEDGAYYDYVLVYGDLEPFRDAPPGPVWRAIVREKSWTLYAKTGAASPAWSSPDEGPCVPRRAAELARRPDG
jgi:hypothetical protein